MSDYFFGLGPDWLPASADAIARKHGAELVNHTDPQCNCGQGCAAYECEKSRRHWFAVPNRGNPWDQRVADAVFADLDKAGIATTLEQKRWRRSK